LKTILHLDRSELFHKIITHITNKLGMKVECTNSFQEAFTLLDEKNIDLIICGMELQGITAIEFLQKLNASEHKDIPVIIVTSNDSDELREELFSLGVVDYILKKDLTQARMESYLQNLYRRDALFKRLAAMSIAIIDDSLIGRTVAGKILKSNGIHDVDFYQSAATLLESGKIYDFYLVDVIMPDISGEQLVLNLRQQNKKAIIIAMSGIKTIKTMSNLLLSGANDYLIKPFDASLFMARLKANVRTYMLVEALEIKRDHLQHLADTDGLTELNTHRKIMEELSNQISTPGAVLSILLLDLDKFKEINDSLGHSAGDTVLREVSRVFMEERPRSTLGRYGGEEFLLLLPGMGLQEAQEICEIILSEVRSLRFSEYPELKISFSAGLVEYQGENVRDLIDKADDLLYKAKKNGRNQIISN
jgi:two-component system cell cycle response regulator